MKTGKTRRAAALLLIVALLAGLPVLAGADRRDQNVDLDVVMAQSVVAEYALMDDQGNFLQPRRAPELKGRGDPEAKGVEPDYRGVLGYMALQNDWEVSRFNTFTQTPWQLPVYAKDGDKWKIVDTIRHKTGVLVIDQEIRESMGYKYTGYLEVIRLDTNDRVWIDVAQFATVPYWTLPLSEAMNYGFCIAVYRNNSRTEPMDGKKHLGTLPDGLRVLMCDRKTSYRYISPDRENHPLLGIVFRSKEASESYFRSFLYFNPEDLTLVY